MIDRDLAELYGVETRVLNQAVKRNIEQFPDDFRFELSREECLRSQIVISNGRGGNRYSTYAFTEQGVAMLSSVLRSQTAIEVNIQIMRAFVSMRSGITISLMIYPASSFLVFRNLQIRFSYMVTGKDIQDFIDNLQDKYSYSTIKKCYEFFSALITYGLDDGDFPKDYNPMKTVELPSEDSVAVKTKKIEILPTEDLDLF